MKPWAKVLSKITLIALLVAGSAVILVMVLIALFSSAGLI
jgi:hypothetical protein